MSPDPPSSSRALPGMGRLFPGVFYGWVVAGGAFLVSAVTVGCSFYGLSVFLDALCTVRGWSRTEVSGATTLFFVAGSLTGTMVGRSVDRRGSRGWIAAGALVLAAGYVAIGQVSRTSELYAAYALAAIGQGMGSGVAIGAILARWFVTLRARAVAFSQTGVSVGGALVVPVASVLVERGGLRTATTWLAISVVVVVLPVVLWVLRSDPREHGLEPDGSATRTSANPLLSEAVQRRAWTRREALRTPAFWLLAGSFGATLLAQNGLLLHELAFLRTRLGSAAPYVVSLTAVASVVGRLIVGAVGDRVPKLRVAQVVFSVQAIALAGLALLPSPSLVIASAVLFGLTIGNVFLMQSLLAAELFGMVSYGTVFGMVQLTSTLTAACGPFVLGILSEGLGGYEEAIGSVAGIPVAAALVLGIVRAPYGVRADPSS